jgi:hypothetical protein
VTADELLLLRRGAKLIERPSHYAGPPKQVGATGAGSLKADQWRSAVEFDYTVGFARLICVELMDNDADRSLALKATLHFATAVRIATSEVTSTWHAATYLEHMKEYYDLLKQLGQDFVPNHHFALHLPEMLMRFGPMHNWWMFPFERLIYSLQKVKKNCKEGKARRTVMYG